MSFMKFTYPTELPICAAKDDIIAAIQRSQVVIIQGQTGSGKTTQIPKMLLEMGRGSHGHRIAHTQPRRIAARAVAERLCQETQTRLGDDIGYQVRFTDESSPSTRLVIMTDGILLAQIQRDPLLSRYDTIVIDEAHERSLNIDFLLGYLTALLPKRRDLKLIVTSATIDAEKFRTHFEQALHHSVPVIEVSGRTYPVKIVYEPAGMPPALTLAYGSVDSATAQKANSAWRNANISGGNDDDFDDVLDMPSQVARACQELIAVSRHERGARDILVFASGERDIREFEQAIRHALPSRTSDPRAGGYIEIIPLFARLSAAEQHKIFDNHSHQRIVIATNVAETSLTVPGIRYVVDPGTARISRYSKTAKVQRLPIEPISQASANQRAGRTGRVADGICIRLYSKEDFDSRPEFTDPEILRTSLGAVVLHMLSVGVAHTAEDVTNFGFIDPPDTRSVSDGVTELNELGAITRNHGQMRLTRVGKLLAKLPIDVRLGRMIVQAGLHSTPRTLAAIVVITAFLSLQDPRERPEEKREEADRIHNRYADPDSDFLTILNIWHAFLASEPSNRQLRKKCEAEYMSFLRMRQWKDLVEQLSHMCAGLHWKVADASPNAEPAGYEQTASKPLNQQAAHSLVASWDGDDIHRCMLSGLLSNLGMQVVREPKASDFNGLNGAARAKALKRAQKQAKNNYQGARGTRFALFPASALFKSTPAWVMAADLTETSRLWARMAAKIDPSWAEELAGELTKTTYVEPHWSANRGAAVATSRVLLYGLPIVADRTILWGRINPFEARSMLLRNGLVEGQVTRRFAHDEFIERNRELIEQGHEDAARTRHVVDTANDEDLYQFYDRSIPQNVTSIVDLAKWLKSVDNAHILDFDPARDVARLDSGPGFSYEDFPNVWQAQGTDSREIDLRLTYAFHPGLADDGVSVHIPLRYLSRLSPREFTWLVPGMRRDLITAYIKALPKQLRVQFVPAPQSAQTIATWIGEHEDDLASVPFVEAFMRASVATIGAQIHPSVFDDSRLAKLPAHLKITFVVEKDAPGKDEVKKAEKKAGLVASFGDSAKNTVRRTRFVPEVLASGKDLLALQSELSEQAQRAAQKDIGRTARKAGAQGKAVTQATILHQSGASALPREEMLWKAALKQLHLPDARISSRWLGREALILASAPYSSTDALVEDLQYAAIKRLLPSIADISSDEQLDAAIHECENTFEDAVYDVAHDVMAIIQAQGEVESKVSGTAELPLLAVLQGIRSHVADLTSTGFIARTPAANLPEIPRYLQADMKRLEKAKLDKSRDVNWAWQAKEAQDIVDQAKKAWDATPAGPARDLACKKYLDVKWMREEFLVSLWAQELGVKQHPSIQRMRKLLS